MHPESFCFPSVIPIQVQGPRCLQGVARCACLRSRPVHGLVQLTSLSRRLSLRPSRTGQFGAHTLTGYGYQHISTFAIHAIVTSAQHPLPPDLLFGAPFLSNGKSCDLAVLGHGFFTEKHVSSTRSGSGFTLITGQTPHT